MSSEREMIYAHSCSFSLHFLRTLFHSNTNYLNNYTGAFARIVVVDNGAAQTSFLAVTTGFLVSLLIMV
jgi:hypothetical protein